MEIVGYALALTIGLIMGMVGAGGSILSSSLLVYIFGITPVLSASYTLLNVGIISMVGSVQYYRKGLIDIRTGLFFSLPALLMIYAMRRFVMPGIPDTIYRYHQFIFSKGLLIMLVFAVLMIAIAYSMIRKPGNAAAGEKRRVNKWMIVILGLIVGILTGFVGVGGGFIIVPSLIFFANLAVKQAVGTSLFIITLNTAVGFTIDFSSGVIYDWNFLLKFISITVAGMILSGQLTQHVRSERIKQLFGYTVLFIGCWIIVKELVLG